MTPEHIKEIQAMLDAATPGPWTVRSWHEDGSEAWDKTMPANWIYVAGPKGGNVSFGYNDIVLSADPIIEDARLIAAAPTIIAELLAEVAELQKEVHALEEEQRPQHEAREALLDQFDKPW